MTSMKQAIRDAARVVVGGASAGVDAARAALGGVDAQHAAQTLARGLGAGVGLVGAVGRQAPAVLHDVARDAMPHVKKAATGAGKAARVVVDHAVPAAGTAAAGAATAFTGAARAVASQVSAWTNPAAHVGDARPHERVNARTGQRVVCEAYVRRPDGTHDYDAVYPNGPQTDFGPVGNKVVGAMLLMAGVPMLVLPGPGIAAVTAGLYYLTRGGRGDVGSSQDR